MIGLVTRGLILRFGSEARMASSSFNAALSDVVENDGLKPGAVVLGRVTGAEP